MEEMLSIQKSSSDKPGLGYFSSIPSYTTPKSVCHDVIFIPPYSDNKIKSNAPKGEIKTEVKNDKERCILGATPKETPVKKEVKKDLHRSSNQKVQPKRAHFYHHCGITGHTRPNY